jgi:hypothetical protein
MLFEQPCTLAAENNEARDATNMARGASDGQQRRGTIRSLFCYCLLSNAATQVFQYTQPNSLTRAAIAKARPTTMTLIIVLLYTRLQCNNLKASHTTLTFHSIQLLHANFPEMQANQNKR